MRPAALVLALLAFAVPTATAGACTTRPAATEIAGLKLVNYYPSDNAWTSMWTRWRPRSLERDFGRIADLHANAVRLVVAPRAFGYPRPRSRLLRRLRDAVALASARGLRVQLTLFDWWGDYGDVERSKAWADAVLAPFAADPRIAFVELKNEIDPADPAATAWARELLPHVRGAACGAPVTVSALGTEPGASVRLLRDALGGSQPDFYDVHYFGRAELAYRHFREARAEAGALPLFVGEVGYSTFVGNGLVQGLPRSRAGREAQQDHHLRTVQHAARSLGLPAAAPWAFADFRRSGIPAGGPRDVPNEHFFGLFRADGTAKPAIESLRRFFRTGAVSTAFNNGFEKAVRSGRRDLPAGWQMRGAAHGSVSLDERVFRSGSASLRLASADGQPTGRLAVRISPIAAAVEEGAGYAAAVWAHAGEGRGRATVALRWFDGAARAIGRSESAALSERGRWARLRVAGTAPPGAAFVQIVLEARGSRKAVWFDDVTFGPLSP